MKKGQAFDTFQLMIAAVIAVAILGILLSIIGQIFIPSQRPIQVIREKLTDAYQNEGTIFPSPTKTKFQKDEYIPMSTFGKNTDGTPPELHCSDSITSTDAGLVTCGDAIQVLKTFETNVAACCSNGCHVYVGCSGLTAAGGTCPLDC